MSVFTREEKVEGLAEQDYVPQHPVMSMPKPTSKSKSDHLDLYQEVHPFGGCTEMSIRQCKTKMSDFESSEGLGTFIASKVGLIKSARLVEKDEATAFKKAVVDFFESKQTNLHVHTDRTFRCDAKGKKCEEGLLTYMYSNADYSLRHDAEPYQDGMGFAHTRPEHDFALFVTNETYMGTGSNDYNATVGCTEKNGELRPRRAVTTMLDGRELKYQEDLSLPGTAIYIAEGNDVVPLRTLVIGFRGSRFDFVDGSALWDWMLSDACILLGIPFQETPRFKYSEQHVLRLLLDSDRFDQVIFTGHSLGGTLANTMYHQLHTILPDCSGSIIFNAGVGLEVDGGGNVLNTASYRMVNDPVSGRAIKILPGVLEGTGRLDGIVTRNSVSFDGAKNGWIAHVMGNFLPSNVIKRNDGSIVSGNDTIRQRVKLLSIMRSLWMHNDKDFLKTTGDMQEEWSVSMLHDSLANFCAQKIAIDPTKLYIDRFQSDDQLKAEICVLAHAGTGNEKACYDRFKTSKDGQHDVQTSRFFQKGKATQRLVSKSKQDELDKKNGEYDSLLHRINQRLSRIDYSEYFEDGDETFDDEAWKSISTLRFSTHDNALNWASGAGKIMSEIDDILSIEYVAENPNPQDGAASEEFLKQKKQLKNTGKLKWKRAVTLSKLKLKEDNTEGDTKVLETLLMAQEINQMNKSGSKIAKAREKFANFNKKRFFKIEKKRLYHFLKLYTKYGGPLSRTVHNTFHDTKLFISGHAADVFEELSVFSNKHYGIASGFMSVVSYSVDKLAQAISFLANNISEVFSTCMKKFSQNKDWNKLKDNMLKLVPIIAEITGCLFKLAKTFVAEPVVYVLKSGLEFAEDIIVGTAPLKMTAFVANPLLAIVYDPSTGKRRDVMKSAKHVVNSCLNTIIPPYKGEDLKKCGDQEINEQIFDHVSYSPGEKNIGNSFPLLLDYKHPYNIGDTVSSVKTYAQLVHFPTKEFEVIAMSESGRTITVKPLDTSKTYEDVDGKEVTQEEFPAIYFKKK